MEQERRALRLKDFWTAIVLMAVSAGLLLKTTELPFFEARAAGMAEGRWYNSAALVPYMVFGLLFLLALSLLVIAVRDGGSPQRTDFRNLLSQLRAPFARRFMIISAILLGYIFALVPRVDFILATALTMMALTYGFHERRMRPAVIAIAAVAIPSLYAIVVNFPSDRWAKPHDDDWLTLLAFVVLTGAALIESARANGKLPNYMRYIPLVCLLTPTLLVVTMAFGFRQNVPNRTGLLFSQIEYHYYVNLKPLLDGAKD